MLRQITSLFAHKVLAQADNKLDKRSLFRAIGIDPEAPIDPKLMVSESDYYELFATVARDQTSGVDMPLRVGAAMRCEDYGAFGLAWKSALNLRGSFERAERYARVLTNVATYDVRESKEGYYVHLRRDGDRAHLGLRLSNEATISSMAAICDEVSTLKFQPKAVYFKHKMPGSSAKHERHFNCPVYFCKDSDAMLISHETMRAANRAGDPGFVSFFDSHLDEELSKLSDDKSLERRVRNQISQSLSEGIPTVSDIAGRFGMSARSLQRRLSDAGYSYQSLVDDSRRQFAERLLKESSYPLAEIAFLTGFSEQSAFNRAFKRWAGQTPRSFRIQALS